MHCHRIQVADRIRFAGTTTDAVHLRAALCKEHGVSKLPEQMVPIEIPTDKVGLIEYLNRLMGEAERP